MDSRSHTTITLIQVLWSLTKNTKILFKGLQEFYQTNRDKLIWMQNTYCVGNDQPVFNFFVNQYIPADYKVLGYEWNMQDMMRFEVLGDDMLHTRYGYVSHYNAGTPPSSHILDGKNL